MSLDESTREDRSLTKRTWNLVRWTLGIHVSVNLVVSSCPFDTDRAFDDLLSDELFENVADWFENADVGFACHWALTVAVCFDEGCDACATKCVLARSVDGVPENVKTD